MKKRLLCFLPLCIILALTACRGQNAIHPLDPPSSETAPLPAHEHTEVKDNGYAATCSSAGLTDGSHCALCGQVLSVQTVIPQKAHTPIPDHGYAATCTNAGLTDGSHCGICGAVLTVQVPIKAVGHTPIPDPAIAATYSASGLTEGSHCAECGEVLTAQQVIPQLERVKLSFAGGTVTKAPTTITTKHLELKLDANVYVPDDLTETLDIVTDVMEKVSGMKFAGNPHYGIGPVSVEVQKDNSTESEYGSAFAFAGNAVISSGDLLDLSTLVHECTHALQYRQSAWFYCQWAMEGITEYTVYKTREYIGETHPQLLEQLGPTSQSMLNMTITDYSELYARPMEYWIDNILEASCNANYTIGFRLMWYLDETYGNYTDWIFKLEEAYPMYVNSPDGDQLPKDKILEAFYITYGNSVLDDFYAWLKQNEHLFKEKHGLDMQNVTQINLLPEFHYGGSKYSPRIFSFGAEYRNLCIGLDAGNRYLTEYKKKTIDKLVLEVNPGVTVELFNANGELLGTEEGDFGKLIDLTGVSFIRLPGEGKVQKFEITGYH